MYVITMMYTTFSHEQPLVEGHVIHVHRGQMLSAIHTPVLLGSLRDTKNIAYYNIRWYSMSHNVRHEARIRLECNRFSIICQIAKLPNVACMELTWLTSATDAIQRSADTSNV